MNMEHVLDMNTRLVDYALAARLLMESALGEWVDERPLEGTRLAADLTAGRLAINLVITFDQYPCIKLVASALDGSHDDQALVEFFNDKKGWH